MKIYWLDVRNFLLVYILTVYVYLGPIRNTFYLFLSKYFGPYFKDETACLLKPSKNIFSLKFFVNPYGEIQERHKGTNIEKTIKENIKRDKTILFLLFFGLIEKFIFGDRGGISRLRLIDSNGEFVVVAEIIKNYLFSISNQMRGSPISLIISLFAVALYGMSYWILLYAAFLYIRKIIGLYASFKIEYNNLSESKESDFAEIKNNIYTVPDLKKKGDKQYIEGGERK